ncbi:hypothetical protein TWF696_009660 [Orbilia brochopaga]|uniref:Uncharacterized protein n=1 Tax=Orbilia brochopaga TaxID=3140254 RepID=A0AAV9UCV1_9PEZI
MAASTTTTLTHSDPDITAKLRSLQSRVQVWIKPTDRILTDADAYEYDCYRAERKSDGISFNWGVALIIFAVLLGGSSYYTCLLLVSGRVNGYLLDDAEDIVDGTLLGELISVVAFHLSVFPAVAMFLGNRKVRNATLMIGGYCVLGLALAGIWWWKLFGEPAAVKNDMHLMCVRLRPFGVGMAADVNLSGSNHSG